MLLLTSANHLAELVHHGEALHSFSLDGDIAVGRVGEEVGLHTKLVHIGRVLHGDVHRAAAVVAFCSRRGGQDDIALVGLAPGDHNAWQAPAYRPLLDRC